MEKLDSKDLKSFQWVNKPTTWTLVEDVLTLSTDDKTDFWQKTFYNFERNSGHLFGKSVSADEDFCFSKLDSNALRLFKWLNEPNRWTLFEDVLTIRTDIKTHFWQKTYYDLERNSGHLFGKRFTEDFCFSVCVEADFTNLYDQAGLMVYLDSSHWLKAGIEYNDGQPMISSVMTNGTSDWATGVFTGNPRKFWIRVSKVGAVVCVKYSTDNITWTLLRLCQFPLTEHCVIVGPMCCSPQREGLMVKFSDFKFGMPNKDILHSN